MNSPYDKGCFTPRFLYILLPSHTVVLHKIVAIIGLGGNFVTYINSQKDLLLLWKLTAKVSIKLYTYCGSIPDDTFGLVSFYPSGCLADLENLENGTLLRNIRENLEKSGKFFKKERQTWKSRGNFIFLGDSFLKFFNFYRQFRIFENLLLK